MSYPEEEESDRRRSKLVGLVVFLCRSDEVQVYSIGDFSSRHILTMRLLFDEHFQLVEKKDKASYLV